MASYYNSTILFNKSINSGGAAFMEERRSQKDNDSSEPSATTETPSHDLDPKAMFDSYMS